jgi:catechol 2,3-dioxygenase-like lactoylglutathione lyase family enzyme
LVSRVAHIALASRDLERLTAFYADVFDAHDPYGRSPGDRSRGLGFIAIGEATVLHVFEQRDGPLGGLEQGVADRPLARGRLDHVSLEAADPEAFTVIRDRLMACGASDGAVIDFGPLVSVFFLDPDGFQGEVSLTRPPGWQPPFDTVSPRAAM